MKKQVNSVNNTPKDLACAMEELQVSYEELRVAEEELLAQNEELQRTQNELIRERQRYQELFELAPDGYIVTDGHGIIGAVNQVGVSMLGIEPHFLRGKPLANFFPSETRSSFRILLLQLKPAQRLEWENHIVSRQGQTFRAQLTVVKSQTQPGEKDVLRWLIRDITAHCEAQEQLYTLNQRLNALIQAAPLAIFTIDNSDCITMWNPACEALYGWKSEDVLGRAMPMVAAEFRADFELRRAQARQGHSHDGGEVVQIRRDGGRLNLSLWTTPLLASDGRVEATLAMVIDISERKEAETAKRQFLDRLVQVQEEVRRRISRELHDHLGQHLSAILLSLNQLQCRGNEPQNEGRSGEARQIEHLKVLIDSMMQTTHRIAWELRPPELDDLGLEVALRHYTQKWAKNTGILIDFQTLGSQTVRLEPGSEIALYRVAQEALTNVARHAGAKKVSVIIDCSGQGTTVIVEDDGCGFDLPTPATAESPKKPRRLGLTGMRERLEQVGGQLEIEAASGQGTTIFARVSPGAALSGAAFSGEVESDIDMDRSHLDFGRRNSGV